MSEKTKQSRRHVESVMAALSILDCFSRNDSMRIREIIEETGFTRNRVMRLAGTLEYMGYLTRDPKTDAYSPGPKLPVLGKAFERSRAIVVTARPVLRRLVLQTGESATLYVREGLDRVVLAREEGTHAVRYSVSEGQRMNLHIGAGGKVLLAFAPEEVVRAVISTGTLTARTRHTITDPAVLLESLEKTRKNGYAVSRGERVNDACAIAAPVFDGAGDLVGALGLAGPVSRFTAKTRRAYTALLLEEAEAFSKQLWYAPSNGKMEKEGGET